MPISRLGDWIADGLEAYAGRDVQSSPFVVGLLSLVALFVALLVAGIALEAYIIFVIAGLAVFLVLYVLYRGLLWGFRRLT